MLVVTRVKDGLATVEVVVVVVVVAVEVVVTVETEVDVGCKRFVVMVGENDC